MLRIAKATFRQSHQFLAILKVRELRVKRKRPIQKTGAFQVGAARFRILDHAVVLVLKTKSDAVSVQFAFCSYRVCAKVGGAGRGAGTATGLRARQWTAACYRIMNTDLD